jgi:hypothetical protein
MSTLAKCREIDRQFERTVLIRNKLDKYYSDLTDGNVHKWVDGFGDLPEHLMRFALTLPWWEDGTIPPRSFAELREEKNEDDVKAMQQKGLSTKHLRTVGFRNFQLFMENKTEKMFVEALGPVMKNLRNLKETTETKLQEVETEFAETDPNKILSTTRDCGTSFATALTHVMEGVLRLKGGRVTLETELKEFYTHHQSSGASDFDLLPSDDFATLPEYIDYLRNDLQVGAFDVEINGGAQFRRLMTEVEIFLRFSEISVETKKRDVIQARGVSMCSLSWRDVIVKLLSNEAHSPLQRRVQYVGERIKWFFEKQKEVVIEFMDSLKGTPSANMFSPLYPKHVRLIKQNAMIKHLVFQTYDQACKRQLQMFLQLFDNMLTSTFSNPWVFLKGYAAGDAENMDDGNAVLPSFDDTKTRIPGEIKGRSGIDGLISKWLQDIPSEPERIDDAVDKVQMLVLKTYSYIRSQVCDQVELFAESFFKLPMMRRLEEDMSMMELTDQDRASYDARRLQLTSQAEQARVSLREVGACLDRLNGFKLKCDARVA